MHLKKHQKRLADLLKGMSIVEITTAIGIIGIISIMVVSIYFAYFRLFSNQSKTIDIANETRIAIDAITNQIRESSAVVSSCPVGSPYNGCGGSTTSTSATSCNNTTNYSAKVVLQLWPLDSNSNPTDPGSSNYDYVVIKRDDLENTKLKMITYPSSTSSRKSSSLILSNEISCLSFTFDNADPTQASEVTAGITNTTTQFGKNYTQSQETRAVIRNK